MSDTMAVGDLRRVRCFLDGNFGRICDARVEKVTRVFYVMRVFGRNIGGIPNDLSIKVRILTRKTDDRAWELA